MGVFSFCSEYADSRDPSAFRWQQRQSERTIGLFRNGEEWSSSFTTLMYVLVYHPPVGVTGWGWLWVIQGLVLDISSYSSSAYANRNRMPGYSGT